MSFQGPMSRLMRLVEDYPSQDIHLPWQQVRREIYKHSELKLALDRAIYLSLSWLKEDLGTLFRLLRGTGGGQALQRLQKTCEDLVQTATMCHQQRYSDIEAIARLVEERWNRRFAVSEMEIRVQ